MIPTSLANRANYIFKDMGGLEQAQNYLNDNQIIDVCLYGGYVAVFKPYRKTFVGSIGGSFSSDYSDDFDVGGSSLIDPSELFDLGLLGYQKDTYYSVLDENFVFQYRERAVRGRIDGVLSYYYGLRTADDEFLYAAKHGSVFYIHFLSETGRKLIKVVLNSYPNPTVYNDYLIDLQKATTKRQQNIYNELVISTSEVARPLTLHYKELPLRADPSDIDLANDPLSQTVEYGTDSIIFFKTLQNLWFCLREYDYNFDSGGVENLLYSRADVSIENLRYRGYLLHTEDIDTLTTKSNYLIFSREEEDFYRQDVRLSIDGTGSVDEVIIRRYRNVRLESLSGVNVDKLIPSRKNSYYLAIKEVSSVNPIRPGIKLGRPLTRGVSQNQPFQISANAVINLG